MAKNLKISIKNTQLAEALKLGKIKKPTAKKRAVPKKSAAKAEEEIKDPLTTKKQSTPPKEPEVKVAEKAATAPIPEDKSEPAAEAPPAPVEKQPSLPKPKEQAQPPSTSEQQKSHTDHPRMQSRDFPQRQAAPRQQAGGYPPRSGFSAQRPGQHPGQQPYRSGPGFPGPKREGFTPGSRPPYRPRPPQPGGQGGFRPSGPGGQGGFRPSGPGGQGGFRPGGPGGQGGFRPSGGAPPSTSAPRPDVNKEDRKTPRGPQRPGVQRPGAPRPGQKDFREHKPSKKMNERSFDARDRQGLRDFEDGRWRKRRPSHKMRSVSQEEVIRPKELKIRIPIAVKDLAAEMKLKASQLISKLFMKGIVLTINDFLDDETTIQLLGHDFDCEVTIDRTEEDRLRITDKTIKQEVQDSTPEELTLRPPVVAFMGHVDHGKTSLIDAIRKSDLAAGESGAITQHIGAFKSHTTMGDITILDTPGHEAFSAMRSRGADVTDIIVLVVAGDEGMRAQTLEAIEQAKSAAVPILVAINKCDKPGFDPDTIYRQLSDVELLPETWGGQTITTNCSALTKEGVPQLLEMLALQAEILELKANSHTRARGSVIESEMHKGMGSVATLLVQNGTLRLGDAIVFSHEYAKVKTMHDEHDKELKEAGPSTPVKITGLSGLPEAGSEFIVVKDEKEAMEIAKKRSEGHRHALLHQTKKGLDSVLAEKATSIQKKTLNLILRADVQGSVEALKTSLLKIETDKVDLNFVSAAVGEVSESDVQLASASKAVIIGFHTQVESHAEGLIRSSKVKVRLHDIIYHAVDDVKEIMTALLDKLAQETTIGSAEVKAVFKSSQLGLIAGCMVLDGQIKRSSHVKQLRNDAVIWKGPIHSLKRVKEDVREVSKGYECGIVLSGQGDVKEGDVFEAFEITYLKQEL